MKVYSSDYSKEIKSADALDALLSSGEPVQVEVQTAKRRMMVILCGVKKNGSFDVSIPNGISGEDDEPFEATYHIDDVKVFADV